MNIALDIDGTITQQPELFAVLSRAVRAAGGRIYIITSRADTSDVRTLTQQELKNYGIDYDDLLIIPDADRDRFPCPHDELDWYQKYLWQKVYLCLEHNITIVFDDEGKVVDLFKKYAPHITLFQVV